jgi:hypothetical protein
MAAMRTKQKPQAVALQSEAGIDARVVAEVEDDAAWEAPVSVHRGEPAALELLADLAARAAFLARIHHAAGMAEWLTRVIRERIEVEEGAFAAAKREMAARRPGETHAWPAEPKPTRVFRALWKNWS